MLHWREKQRFIFKIKTRNLKREGRPRPMSLNVAEQFCLIHRVAQTLYFKTTTCEAILRSSCLKKIHLKTGYQKGVGLGFNSLSPELWKEGTHNLVRRWQIVIDNNGLCLQFI
ncbi:hypothetical protein B9Z55_007277 [Caenorhabditis nigoni]|uniref:Uncharacterized protein n=1 Tax=Caenorhabditis nigoni TaxID=1611254 RepID=A0A2G5V8U7_9PELO|nr:hypothetical protein B9Z55_007277 [Caenorhabditis nigoni]